MNLQGLGLANVSPAVVILGAGASRGASFTGQDAGGPLPPLDADFFHQLERLPHRSRRQRRLLEFVEAEFGSSARSMENVFSQLMASDEISSLPQRRRGPHLQGYRRAAEDFYVSLTELLETTCAGKICLHHNAVVERLKARDAIISFNYDCLIDSSLAQNATHMGDGIQPGVTGIPLQWVASTGVEGRDHRPKYIPSGY